MTALLPSLLRRFFKRLLICSILGAILQYAIAVAFGLSTARGDARRAWLFEASEGPIHGGFAVDDCPTFGKHVLVASLVLMQLDLTSQPVKPDWSRGEWHDYSYSIRGPGSVSTHPLTRQPPAWSRFLSIQTDPDFDYFDAPNWPGFSLNPGWGGLSLEAGCGWPMPSASYFARETRPFAGYVTRDGIELSKISSTGMPRVIPLTIYWPGALINTLVYSTALLVLFVGIPMTRRHLRCRHGHCVNCNYDLRATTTGACPECGAAIPPRVTT